MLRVIAKTWVTVLLAACLLASVSLADVSTEVRVPAFEITRNGESVGYLIGTMHTDDPRVMAMLGAVRPLLERVDTLAIEMVPDGIAMLAVGAASLLPGAQRLSELVGPERYTAVRETARARGMPEAILERLKPWAAAITLGVPEPAGSQVLDTAIYLAATEQGVSVVGLETAAEQIHVFDAMPAELELQLLDAMVKNADQLPMQFEAMIAAYLSGDVARIDAVARHQYGEVPKALQQWFDRALLAERNARMLERALPLFDDGRVMIAVGAMHLGGRSGLISGLGESGFVVVPLTGRSPGRFLRRAE
jgi:uncharacterized protein YbaP (TraB family)